MPYARLLVGRMGLRWKLSTGSCVAPCWQFPTRCTTSYSFPTPCLAARCFLAVLFSSSPVDSMSGLFWWCYLAVFSSCDQSTAILSSFYFYFYWQLICLGPQSVVADFVRPLHIYNSPAVSLYERQYLIHCLISNSPCFGAIIEVTWH